MLLAVSSHTFAQNPEVVGYLVYWDKDRGIQTIQDNPGVLTQVTPWAFTLNAAGDVILDPYGGASVVDTSTISLLRDNGISVIPAVHNLVGGSWNSQIVHDIITDPTLKQHHIDSIVSLVLSNDYDGIDINYENLFADDRDAYSLFMADLADVLHSFSKLLTTDVYGKIGEPAWWSGPEAQDYAALGSVVDQVRIFFYDFNPSQAGPNSPLWWVDDTLAYAVTQIPAHKIVAGLPFYGYDWGRNDATARSWSEMMATAANAGVTVNWDPVDLSPTFSYVERGKRHEAWFANAASTSARVNIAEYYGVGGLSFWPLGQEEPTTWALFSSRPVVTISAPSDGAVVVAGDPVDLQASAFDAEDGDLSALLVWESSLDGVLGAGAALQTALSPGTHTISASVTDGSGNDGVGVVTVTSNEAGAGPPKLVADGYTVKKKHKVDLVWSGASTASVQIVRDGMLVATTENDGFFTDSINGRRRRGSYTYVLCESVGTNCSAEVTVAF